MLNCTELNTLEVLRYQLITPHYLQNFILARQLKVITVLGINKGTNCKEGSKYLEISNELIVTCTWIECAFSGHYYSTLSRQWSGNRLDLYIAASFSINWSPSALYRLHFLMQRPTGRPMNHRDLHKTPYHVTLVHRDNGVFHDKEICQI